MSYYIHTWAFPSSDLQANACRAAHALLATRAFEWSASSWTFRIVVGGKNKTINTAAVHPRATACRFSLCIVAMQRCAVGSGRLAEVVDNACRRGLGRNCNGDCANTCTTVTAIGWIDVEVVKGVVG